MFNIELVNSLRSVNKMIGKLPAGYFSLCSDSRKYESGEFFMAIAGDNLDGFDYVDNVLKTGCPVVAFYGSDTNIAKASEYAKTYSETCFVAVNNTLDFLQELAHKRVLQWKNSGGLIIGITGSNGKTTHKEMLFHLLNGIVPGKVQATKGNFNNHYGVPFTILDILDSSEIAIIEMGSNHPGEIGSLCDIAMPECGIISNIGDSHLEFFHNRDNVFVEKRALYEAIKKQSGKRKLFVSSNDDVYLATLEKSDWHITFGKSNDNNQITYEERAVSIATDSKSVRLENETLIGKHNFSNLACCFLMAEKLFPNNFDKLVELAKTFVPGMNRSEVKSFGEKKIFSDAYNANPSSMEASVEAFFSLSEIKADKTLFILGDMNELGENAESLHEQTGRFCKELGVKHIVFVGNYANCYKNGFGESCELYKSTDDLEKEWDQYLKKFDNFFIKGSRTLQLESLVDIKYFNNTIM